MNVLRRWMAAATPAERRALALAAGTSYGSLHQMAGAYKRGGVLAVSAEMARRLEQASAPLERPGLPVLRREELSPACAQCEFARMCRKD